jgi:branched-subunit amino acid ABC-type transport system permease component
VAIAVGAALGFAIEWLTIRPLHGRPALVKVVVTIGWLLVLQTAAGLIWGATAYHQPVRLVSRDGFHLPGANVTVGYDQLTTVVVALIFALAVAALLRYTTLGNAMRAVADNPDTARLWGISVNRVTAASWMVGSAMAAVAGVLITPLIAFDTFSLTVVVIYAFTAALIGRLSSLPMTVIGGFLLGLAQTYPRMFSSLSGTADLVTFALVLLTLGVLFRPGGRRVRVV